MGSERHESCLGHLSFPDDSCHHHFPSLIVGLPAIPKPFLPRLAGHRGRLTDVSFRKCGLFTPLPGRQLPLGLVERADFTVLPLDPPAQGLLVTPMLALLPFISLPPRHPLPLTCPHLPLQWLPLSPPSVPSVLWTPSILAVIVGPPLHECLSTSCQGISQISPVLLLLTVFS